ncbi:MAG TPA: sigma-70 family RNA polymerase sigma factor [Nitrospirae bacterium]|nr:sigma-70 family RNA polymerase sigma factor [Nitrospirota bacterium]
MREQKEIKQDDDHEIIVRCQKGDVEAFEEIVNKYQKKMFNISYRMLSDYNDASEVVQDAFVSVYKNIKSFKGRSRFFTWLYTIVVNLSRNRIKQVKTMAEREQFSIDEPIETDDGQVKAEFASGDLSVLEKLEKRELEIKVQTCINALEHEFREVIVLRDLQGFAYEEISDMLKIAAGTVKSRLHRARDAVKNCLKKVIEK